MNSLLNVKLIANNRHGSEVFAEASVICKNEDVFNVFDRFFSCFNQEEEKTVYPLYFSTQTEIAPIWEMTENSVLAEELTEDNPFGESEGVMSTIWNILNEWLYSPKYEKIVKGGAVA